MKKLALIFFSLIALLTLVPQLLTDTTYYTSFISNFLFEHNLHEVVPGRFYRSAEMSRTDLEKTVRKLGIKTVIDLRLDKDSPDESGVSESQAAQKGGAAYHHIPLSSARADQKPALMDLLNLYQTEQAPMLVHCSSGTHRSGIASAIWLLDREHYTYEQAMEQLTARYGFFEIERKIKTLWQGKPTLDRVMTEYHSDATEGKSLSFRDWLQAELNAMKQPEAPHS